MTAAATAAPPGLLERVDGLLAAFLEDARREVAGDDPGAAPLVDEVIRVVASGGKRLRPAFCFRGIWRPAAVTANPSFARPPLSSCSTRWR